MQRYLIAVLVSFLYTSAALADSKAVEALNFEIGAAYSDYQSDTNEALKVPTLSAGFTLPLARYVGAAFSTSFSKERLTFDYPGGSYFSESDTSAYGTGIFMRDADIGMLRIDYIRSRTNTPAGYFISIPVPESVGKYNVYVATASYYIRDFTLSANHASGRLRIESENIDIDFDSTDLSVGWYLTANLSAGISATRSKSDDSTDNEKSHTVGVEYQPRLLDNSTSFFLDYNRISGSPKAHTVGVGISYYFDKRPDLKTRDRHYR